MTVGNNISKMLIQLKENAEISGYTIVIGTQAYTLLCKELGRKVTKFRNIPVKHLNSVETDAILIMKLSPVL